MGKPTNIYYYGARYYNPRWSSLSASGGWLSVDPLAGKYPHASPYNYVLNNPVVYNDPDGRSPVLAGILIGIAADFTMQMTKNLFKRKGASGKRFDFKYALKNIDIFDAGVAGAVGAFLPLSGIFAKGLDPAIKNLTKRLVKYSGKLLMFLVDMNVTNGKIIVQLPISKEKGNLKERKEYYADLINLGIGIGLQELDFRTGAFSNIAYGSKLGYKANGDNYSKYYLGNQLGSNFLQQMLEGYNKGVAYLGYENSGWYNNKLSVATSNLNNIPKTGGSGLGALHLEQIELENLLK